MNRINQHHVWRSYLEAWAVNGSFACRRKNGKPFETQPKSVASQRYFYRVEEITEDEIALIERLFLSKMPTPLQQLNRNWFNIINSPFKDLAALRAQGIDKERLDKIKIELENNILELIHSNIEESGKKYLSSIRKKDVSFFLNEDEKENFLFFLTTQYFRTTKMKANTLENAGRAIKNKLGYDLEKIWNPISHILATSTSYNMSLDESIRLVLLENKTTNPFLTGDQPVLNTHATNVPNGELTHMLELYYPVSPTLAVLLTSDMASHPTDFLELDEKTVDLFNNHIIKHSYTDIYSTSKAQLETLLD